MVKLAICAFLFCSTAVLSWTGYHAASSSPAPTVPASTDPLASEAAYRHRNNLPNHWRGYVLQPRSF